MINKHNMQIKLLYWQDKLRLNDWNIEIVRCDPWNLAQQNRISEVEYEEATKQAVIRLTYLSNEQSLIHELLHLKFCLLDDSGNQLQDRLVHQTIDDLAKAFAEIEND